jgi:hypothetical protein
MTTDLMKPRWKVIADYPKNPYHVGDILNGGFRSEDLIYCDDKGPRWRDYPHLFRKLEWWEERKPEEMPEYVKFGLSKPTKVLPVNKWLILEEGEVKLQFRPDGNFRFAWEFNNFLPATPADYEAQSNQKK